MAVPYTFGTATAAIPLSQLDSNFATAITIGNTAVQLGNTVTTLNNMTLANVTISSGTVTITNVAVTTANVSGTANISTLVVVGNETVGGNTTITGNITAANANVTTNLVLSGGTANGVAYLNTSKQVTTGSALTYNGSTLAMYSTVAGLSIQTALNTNQATLTLADADGRTAVFRGPNSGSPNCAQIGTTTNHDTSFLYGNAEAMRLTSTSLYTASGINVGIGTSSPAYKLDVKSSTPFVGKMQNGTGASLFFYCNGSSTDISGVFAESNGYNGLILNSSSNYVGLTTNNTERMRIDSSGNLLVGMTSTSGQSGVSIVPASATYTAIHHASGSSSGTEYALFRYNGSGIGSITQNGTTGVLYNLTSDYRLKNNPQTLTGAKEFVMALQPKKWQWWDGSGEGVGFIAHEFMEVAKHSGNGEKDAVDADGKPVYQSIQPSSSEVMANLVAFIQEQQALITQLTARITALEGA
jgi:hypothetical protein